MKTWPGPPFSLLCESSVAGRSIEYALHCTRCGVGHRLDLSNESQDFESQAARADGSLELVGAVWLLRDAEG